MVEFVFIVFFFNDTATTEIYTLSLHDALPISFGSMVSLMFSTGRFRLSATMATDSGRPTRSEEHTSELQSQSNLVCRLLLEKKKNSNRVNIYRTSDPHSHLTTHLTRSQQTIMY